MSTVAERTPPLAPGDNLSREEFLRRWENEPEIKKAELIGGLVYMASPVSVQHGEMEGDVGIWLGTYKTQTPGTAMGHNVTSFLLDDTPQPDLNMRILPECGGLSRVDGKYLSGPPELIVEICRSSAAFDLHQKFHLYEEAGVPEYLAILLHEDEIRWHVLERKTYRPLQPDAGDIWKSHAFPGLWLDGKAIFANDMTQVLATLRNGLEGSEHREFMKGLASRKTGK